MERWVGKTAVVTGASAGIGAAIAVSLANAGVNVVGLARRPHLVEELNKQLIPGKGKIFAKKCDISVREEIVKVFASINEKFGGINIVVNNAALLTNGTFADVGEDTVSDDDIEYVVKTNLLGLITCSREAVKYMKKTGQQGHIVNIGSVGGHYVPAALGLPRLNIYYGTKHAVRASTEAMRLEFSHTKTDIKISEVSPAGVRTDMAKSAQTQAPIDDSPAEPVPDYPLLEASDVADAVLSVIATPPRVNITEVVIRPMGDTF